MFPVFFLYSTQSVPEKLSQPIDKSDLSNFGNSRKNGKILFSDNIRDEKIRVGIDKILKIAMIYK